MMEDLNKEIRTLESMKKKLNQFKAEFAKEIFKKADEGAISKEVALDLLTVYDLCKKYHSPYYSSSALASLTLYPNTETVGKSDYLKLSMVSLRYRVPHAFLEKNIRFIQYANVAFQASNLFMITPYSESDPETGTLAGGMQPVLTINLSLTF